MATAPNAACLLKPLDTSLLAPTKLSGSGPCPLPTGAGACGCGALQGPVHQGQGADYNMPSAPPHLSDRFPADAGGEAGNTGRPWRSPDPSQRRGARAWQCPQPGCDLGPLSIPTPSGCPGSSSLASSPAGGREQPENQTSHCWVTSGEALAFSGPSFQVYRRP